MATTVDPLALGAYFVDGDDVLIRQMGRVLQAWDYDFREIDPDGEQVPAATVSGRLVFGGPPAPDVGDDITTWYVHIPVEVIEVSELVEMRQAKESDEAARPVYELGEQGQLVVAPDGSTILAAEDLPDWRFTILRGGVTTQTNSLVDQLPSRRRTLARFARDYAKAWEDDEDPDVLGMLENNLQVSVRRVMEVTDP